MKKFVSVVSLLLALSMFLSACDSKRKKTTTTTSASSTSTASGSSSSSSSSSSLTTSTSASSTSTASGSSSSSSSSSSLTTSTTTPPTTTTEDTPPVVDPDEIRGVCINEVLGKSYGLAVAPDGGEYDWIELYNSTDAPADISGWMLSNDPDDLIKYVFPQGTVIPAQGYLLVWAVGKDVTPNTPGHYAPFKVSSSGETLVLATASCAIRDTVAVPGVDGVDRDWSYARVIDAGQSWAICRATPSAGNEGSILQLPSDVFTVSADSGFYDDAFDVTFTVEEGYTLKYTTDCSDPLTSGTATVWEGESVLVYDPSSDPVRFANINVQNASGRYQWAPEQIDKCFVLRVAAVDASGVASEVSTRCYFVGFDQKDGYSGLPVVCLTSDPDGLYSKNGGLFVLNNGESSWSASTHDTRDWERQTNFTMFGADGQYLFDQEVGIKVRGTSTRGMVQKSLNVYARAEYGDKEFSEAVFGQRTRSLILRNDFHNIHHLGQGYLQDLIADRDVLTQRSYPVLVFLEGEYYGIYMLYERFSENFVEDRYGIADDNIWTAKKFAGSWGAEFDAPNTESLLACQQDLNDIFVYIRDHDMSQKVHYDYVCSKIDMESLIDLFCFQLYIGNVDFSLAQNVSAWRAIEVDPTNPYADGKWRFVVYDLDISMVFSTKKNGVTFSYDVYSNPFTEDQPYAGPGFLGFTISSCYFKLSGDTLVKDNKRPIRYDFTAKMMQNAEFCEQFVRTMEDLGNFNFAPARVKALLDRQLALLSPVYPAYRKRMVQAAYENTDPDVDEQLVANLMSRYNTALDYYNKRFDIITQYMADAFGLVGTQNRVYLSLDGVDQAQIRVNTSANTVTSEGLSARYYSDYDLAFTALEAPEGFAFDHWEISGGSITEGTSVESSIRVFMTDGATLYVTACYVPVGN